MFRRYFLTTVLAIIVYHVLPAQTPANQSAILSQKLIFPGQAKHTHGSSIVELPNGDKLVAWFQGSGERKSDDVVIMGARLKKGNNEWSKPFLMADTPNLPDCNPVLFLNQQGKLFLVWIAVQANEWEQSILRFRTSTNYSADGAPKWDWQDNILLNPGPGFAEEAATKFKELPDLHRGWATYAPSYEDMILEATKDPKKRNTGWMTRIKPLQYPNGRIVLPLYSDGFNFSMMAISDDFGTTWRASKPMIGRGPIQPALVEKKDGTIVAFTRDSGDAPNKVHKSVSKDKGETWSVTHTIDMLCVASVEALVLKDGRWVLIVNDLEQHRYKLSMYISTDEGENWSKKLMLENKQPEDGGYSYPSIIQGKDGLLYITYSSLEKGENKSIKYTVVDPKKI